MNRSGDFDFDAWLREADQDLIASVAAETDVETALAEAKRPGAARSLRRGGRVGCSTTPAGSAVPELSGSQAGEKRRVWDRLADDDRGALTRAGYRDNWRPGEVLALQGGPPSCMYVILSGWVKIIATNDRGDDALLAARGPGEFVGELAPISGLPRTATIQAMDDVEALVVPRDRLLHLLRDHPRIAEELLRIAAVRLRQSDRVRLEFGGAEFTQRLAAVLLELALRGDPGWDASDQIDLIVTQDELARYARVSRATVVRGLNELRSQGIARTARHRVTITRPDILRNLAAGTTPPHRIHHAASSRR